MKKLLSKIWFAWKEIGKTIGDFVMATVLTVFYFSIFALFAIPYLIFTKEKETKQSNFVLKEKTISTFDEFKNES